jgi:hypothetical protein
VEHVVFFPAPNGTPAFRRVADFDEAVRFVEHLRNVDNVTGASVHTLTEVPLSFRAWYRVELPAPAGETTTAVQESTHTELDTPSDLEAAPDAVAPAAVDAAVEVEASVDAEALAEAPAEPAAEETPSPDFGIEAAHQESANEAPEQIDEEILVGSSTAVLVPDFAPVDPFGVTPIAAASLAQPFSQDIVESPLSASEPELEHASGSRRDRGLGFFAR